jgi:hypothetical protein
VNGDGHVQKIDRIMALGETVVCVVSGGNVDLALLKQWL